MKNLIKKTKDSFYSLNVSNKIIAITALSSFITLLILCSISFYREKNTFSNRKVNEIQTLSRILSSNTVASLRFNDPFTANEYVNSFQHDPDIQSVSIYNSQGILFSHYSRDLNSSSHPEPSFKGVEWKNGSLFYAKEIALNGESIGSLLIEMDTTSLAVATRNSLLTATLLLIGGLAITILLVRRMQRSITDPIKQLAELSERISKEKNYKQRLENPCSDEIGTLINSFNHMLDTVQKHDQSLRNINASLGRIVEERTHDLRLRNEELREAMEATNAASTAKSEFLATMSHELRTPMTAILGMATILEDSNLSEDDRHHVSTISESSDILLELINDLLDYSKIESGQLELEEREFDLLEALEESIEINVGRTEKSNVSFLLNCSPTLPKVISGDETRFKQIVINLLSNALKFTENGHICLEASIVGSKSNSLLRVSIQDTGIGIPHDKLGVLFQQFTQVDSSTTRKYGGTGLGLAITKRLVNAMGGNIEVSSELSKGSVFAFEIPIRSQILSTDVSAIGVLPESVLNRITNINFHNIQEPLLESLKRTFSHWGIQESKSDYNLLIVSAIASTFEQAREIAEHARAAVDGANYILICRKSHVIRLREQGHDYIMTTPLLISSIRKTLTNSTDGLKEVPIVPRSTAIQLKRTRVLLVEDHLINQKVFAKLMKLEGYQIDTADNGEIALEKFEEAPYDLIFMDMHMPVMDGVECTKQIRSRYPTSKQPWIIAFTANVQKVAAEELSQAGVNDILYKPIKKMELRNALESYTVQAKSIQADGFTN